MKRAWLSRSASQRASFMEPRLLRRTGRAAMRRMARSSSKLSAVFSATVLQVKAALVEPIPFPISSCSFVRRAR